ncbi:MAG: tetratricopeptide repeat protein [Acidobacteria bacterium]|nr:tetratricopeptide repeat protein [Acidobacteriota bacterium]
MRFPASVSRWLVAAIALTVCAMLVFAQEAPPPGGGGAPGGAPTTGGPTGPGGTPGVGTPGSTRPQQPQFPGTTPQQQQPFPTDMQRPIFLSGKVVLDDGTPPPEPVVIERICNGQPRPEGWTDSKGRFSFQLGQNNQLFADASVSGGADTFGDFGSSRTGPSSTMGRQRGISERDLMGCDLRASLPGYRSEVVSLSGRRFMDNPDVGTIIMRRLANVEGLTVSITAAAAPKDAKKAFEKGRELAKKRKWPEAQKEFEKAVQLYPKYANAWQDLGTVQEAQNQAGEARKAYAEALSADNKLVKPYVQMAFLWARDNKWQECADASERALRLNPYDYPNAWFVNAVANLNLQKLEPAEKSAREGLKADSAKRIPKMQHVLGIILAQKADYQGAIEHMKGYLSLLPMDSPDIAVVKKQLAEVERFAQAKPPNQQP